jgi:D-alanyl-D-alanine carboxypeptidase/D-alanyl-D-alanine-endopeptidase (penicillin-binding protein 4)
MEITDMKINLLFVFIIGATFSIVAQDSPQTKPVNPIQSYAEQLMQKSSMDQAAFSFYVKDMETGDLVADYNGQMSLPSASTMKLVSTATAMRYLGNSYRFKTQLMYSGELDTLTGELKGDLYIIGGGDPTLGSKYYTKNGEERSFLYAWADSIKQFGIRSISGRVIADASAFNYDGVPTGWVWGDLGNYYGAGPSGLTIFDNMCKISFNTGENAGDSTTITCINPFIPGLKIQNNVFSANSSRDNAYVYGAPYSLDWFVQGSIPKGKDEFIVKASIPDPEYLFAIELDQVLQERGIKTKFAPTSNRQLNKNKPFKRPELRQILTHDSPSLLSIIGLTNERSVNLFAEHILCAIALKRYGKGSTYQGANYCMEYWDDKAGNGLFMTDGSGLSRSNGVSARFLVNLLTHMHKSSAASSFKSTLAIAGKKGTMSSIGRGTSAAGRVYGKSGTISRIKSYAGYVDTKTGKKLAYAMIINNFACSSSELKKYFQYLMVKMALY